MQWSPNKKTPLEFRDWFIEADAATQRLVS